MSSFRADGTGPCVTRTDIPKALSKFDTLRVAEFGAPITIEGDYFGPLCSMTSILGPRRFPA